jgi:WD40 repeat protein
LGLIDKADPGDALGEIFISHATADKVLADRVAESVRQAGHSIFLDSDREDGIAPGAPWQRTLLRELRICDAVVFLNSKAGQSSVWCHSELVVAADLGKQIYSLDLGPNLPQHPLLGSLQGITFESTIDAGIRRLVGELDLDGLAGRTGPRWQRGRPPYPGLAAMDMADAGVFFGREGEVQDLRARVDGLLGQRDGDLVVVMGPSGAGKSSLVRAGLAAGLVVPHKGWAVARPFEPGIRPLEQLASRLAALIPRQLTDSECRDKLLTEGMAAFGEWLIDHTEVPAKRLLITLDQAEQLATVTSSRDCEQFLSVLGGGMGPGSPVTIVMTVRSDRFDEVQRLPVIGPAIRASLVIDRLSRSQLAMVIEGPARRADLTFEDGLVSRLIDDATRGSSGETADALPILAFVLREMYDRLVKDDRSRFTSDDYEQVGRIEGAIERRAEAAEALLPRGSEHVLDRLLLRFVTLSEERPPAARPVPRGELTDPTDKEIVEELEDQRLLVSDDDTVRLAHEHLITAWPRLETAVDACREDLVLQDRLERQAKDWKKRKGELLGHDATIDACSWLARWAEAGTNHTAVGEYIRASRTALRRRRAQLVSVLSVIVVLALAASAIAVVAIIQRSAAVSQSHLAQSEEMAAEATNLLPANGPMAMLLSLQAYKRAQTLQAESALIQASQQPLHYYLLVSGSPVYDIALSPDERTLAVGDDGGHVGLWAVATGRHTATLNEGSPVYGVAFSGDGRTLAAGDGGGHVGLWDVAARRHTATLNEGNPVESVAFSRDGRTLAVGDDGGHVGLWDVAARQRTASLNEGSNVISVAFSRDGKTLAAGDGGGYVGLWNVATRRPITALAEGRLVNSVAFSRDGKTLAVGDFGGYVGLWNVATWRQTAVLNEGSTVRGVAFSRDGKTLAVGDDDGHVGLWDVATRRRTATLAEGSSVYGVVFSRDGSTLAVGDFTGHVGLWNVLAARHAAMLNEASPVYCVAFSPDGKTLAAGDLGGHVGLWNVATGRQTATLNEGSPVYGVAFSPDGKTLAAGDIYGYVGLWNMATGRHTASLNEGSGVDSVAFSPDGKTLGVGDSGGHVGLWAVAARRHTASLNEGSAVDSVALSPDGKTVAAGDSGGHVRLWAVAARRHTASLNEGSAVDSVAFSPDGKTLAAGDFTGHVGLWAVAARRHTASLNEGSKVYSVAFSPDGKTLAAGDYLRSVDMWNTATRQRFADLAEGSPVSSLAFLPHGRALAMGSLNGTIVLLWQDLTNLTPRLFTHLICDRVRGNIPRAKWAEYVPDQPYQKTCS